MSDKNGSAGKPDVPALRAEIAQTRAELGETVQALAAKADVKARAKEQVEQTKARVREAAHQAGDRVRDAAHLATDRARTATDKAKGAVDQASDRAKVAVDEAAHSDTAHRVRANQLPLAAVLASVAAVVGIILIVRGRRR